MGEELAAPAEENPRRHLPLYSIATGVLVLALCYVLWEATRYRGLFGRVSEWQFSEFGQWLPAFTTGMFMLIPIALYLIAVWFIARRRHAELEKRGETAPPSEAAREWQGKAERFRIVADAAALALVLGAVLAFFVGEHMAKGGEPVRLATSAPAQQPPEGRKLVVGQIDRNLMSSMKLDAVLRERTVHFAPIFDGRKGQPIRYFVELLPREADGTAPIASERDALMTKNTVPPAILVLYRRLGYNIAPDFQLIGTTGSTARWPYLTTAILLGAGALIAFLIARLQARRLRRQRRRFEAQGWQPA